MVVVSLPISHHNTRILTFFQAKQNGILGFHYWKDPGATTTWIYGGVRGRFVAFLSVLFVSASPSPSPRNSSS
jgi:hypothetical protein